MTSNVVCAVRDSAVLGGVTLHQEALYKGILFVLGDFSYTRIAKGYGAFWKYTIYVAPLVDIHFSQS